MVCHFSPLYRKGKAGTFYLVQTCIYSNLQSAKAGRCWQGNVDPMIAKAAYDETNAVFIHEGVPFLVPIDAVDTSLVKLVCNDKGCALIAKDEGAGY